MIPRSPKIGPTRLPRGTGRWRCRCAILCLAAPPGLAGAVERALARRPGFDLRRCENLDAADAELDAVILAASPAALTDVRETVARLRRDRPGNAVVVAGADFDGEQLGAVFAAGAHDFVAAPISGDEISVRLRRALGLIGIDAAPRAPESLDVHLRDFVGRSPVFLAQVAKLPTFAGCDAGVLIQGETGTGKELCAQAIHYLSSRASKPWIAVNCGAIPVELIESELFGHVRGAYTTAHTSRDGLVSEAEGGTLFLDDIDCLPKSAQAKLLRFLQEHEYRTLGTNAVRRADVRVIAASNHDLAQLAERGEFRRDLYFRLNILTLNLPALRERREDLPELARHLMARLARKLGRRVRHSRSRRCAASSPTTGRETSGSWSTCSSARWCCATAPPSARRTSRSPAARRACPRPASRSRPRKIAWSASSSALTSSSCSSRLPATSPTPRRKRRRTGARSSS